MSVTITDGIRRLNWGCGMHPQTGWINSDQKAGAHIDITCDIRHGLPLDDESIDYAVTIHALPEIPHCDLVPALVELRRVIRTGGVLRLALPDLGRAIDAYRLGDRDYFLVPDDDARSLGGKFSVQMTWYGYSRSLFTHDFAEELLLRAGFAKVTACAYRATASRFPEIVELDNRERESLFIEASR